MTEQEIKAAHERRRAEFMERLKDPEVLKRLVLNRIMTGGSYLDQVKAGQESIERDIATIIQSR